MKFGEKLSETRKAKGMTQTELAERASVGIAALRKFEQGITAERVNFSYVIALARALGVTCEHFSDCEDLKAAPGPAKPKRKAKGK